MKYIKKINDFFKSPPRLNRIGFLTRILIINIPGIFLVYASNYIVPESYKEISCAIIYCIMGFMMLFYAIFRLHDFNRTGWWLLIFCLFRNALAYLFLGLIFFPGTKGPNEYGLPQAPSFLERKAFNIFHTLKKYVLGFFKIDKSKLLNQIKNYNGLRLTESYRGISVIIIGSMLLISYIVFDVEIFLYEAVIWIPLAFFVYRGSLWANVFMVILYTYEKFYTAFTTTNNATRAGAIIFWLVLMPHLIGSLRVELIRKKKINRKSKQARYCHSCAFFLEENSIFCMSCGEKIITNENMALT